MKGSQRQGEAVHPANPVLLVDRGMVGAAQSTYLVGRVPWTAQTYVMQGGSGLGEGGPTLGGTPAAGETVKRSVKSGQGMVEGSWGRDCGRQILQGRCSGEGRCTRCLEGKGPMARGQQGTK